MTAAPVSVVIPTIGRGELLRACLRSILSGEVQPGEIVVADQSSNGGDGVAEVARSLGPAPIRIVREPGRGIARNLNVGLRAAQHDVVIVTHDDCRVSVDWIPEAAALAATHPASIISGRVLPGGADPRAVPSTARVRHAPRLHRDARERGALSEQHGAPAPSDPGLRRLRRTARIRDGSGGP